ncbi:glycosyltransferase family 2 protein [Olsenella sp. Marseille-P4559]|uniref:glycosyltransferase family 2 protein n=1 Tax=Olsenella sp. Marseille-P4559 TaxID=2364795 RepID=UPI001031A280|nr:glycosyltransferase family 2 protein [Olsenella sp. Marseille-P4559]
MPGSVHREPVVSVVVATCDNTATIRRALESIQNQTLRDHETIVVDDGSTDGTPSVIDTIAERDLSISLVQADGCGLAGALDLGVSRARGHYLVFFDAGGWANPDMLADLVSLAEESSLELAIAGFSASVLRDGRRQDSLEAGQPLHVFPTQHDFRAGAWQLFEGNLLSSPCAKLFLRSRVQQLGLSFADGDGDCNDALSFMAGYVRDVERVGLTGHINYHVEGRSPQRLPGFSVRDYRALERQYGTLVGLYHHWGLDGDPTSMGLIQNRYFECLVDCVTGVFSDRSGLSAEERRQLVGEMVSSDRARLAADVARPRGVGAKAMQGPIRSGNAGLAYTEGFLASFMRRGGERGLGPFCTSL